MTINTMFKEYITTEIMNFDYRKMYQDIMTGDKYVPSQLLHAIEIAVFYCEIKETIDPGLSGMFAHYIQVLRGEHKTHKTISKNELLYIIYKIDDAIKKCNQSGSNKNLYI